MIFNWRLKSELQCAMRQWLRNHGTEQYYTQVYCEVNGKAMYLNEYEVRFLQICCKDYCANGGSLEEWSKHIIVYDGPTKRHHKPIPFNEDGYFDANFKGGNGGFFGNSVTLIKPLQE